jgi:excinuclease ABC subunit C
MAKENALDNLDLKIQAHKRKEEQIEESIKYLEKIVNKKINHILMIDNSNTNNYEPVSVIVSYRNGVKQTSEYRKYKLTTQNRQADVEYIKQGIIKYFKNNINAIPDLFIVDGGLAQVNEARK